MCIEYAKNVKWAQCGVEEDWSHLVDSVMLQDASS